MSVVVEELERVVAAAEAAGELELGERARARLAALREAPAGAGWAYLAARGDEGARAALEAEEPERP